MSAPVNVLAVMGALNLADPDQRAGLNAARAAVAELIEAAETILDPHTPVSVNGQYAALRAALASVQGVQS